MHRIDVPISKAIRPIMLIPLLGGFMLLTGCLIIPYKGYNYCTIQGRVTDAASGAPLKGAMVRFVYGYIEQGDSTATLTSDDGEFRFKPVRHWKYPYMLLSIGEMPLFCTVSVQKQGFETFILRWGVTSQLGWMRNYRLFDRVESFGDLALNHSDVTTYSVYDIPGSIKDGRMILQYNKSISAGLTSGRPISDALKYYDYGQQD
jgi:hypothetical protein